MATEKARPVARVGPGPLRSQTRKGPGHRDSGRSAGSWPAKEGPSGSHRKPCMAAVPPYRRLLGERGSLKVKAVIDAGPRLDRAIRNAIAAAGTSPNLNLKMRQRDGCRRCADRGRRIPWPRLQKTSDNSESLQKLRTRAHGSNYHSYGAEARIK